MGQQHKRRGTSLVPSELCHHMNPCTDRKATLTSEGMYWSGTGGAYRDGRSTAPRQGVDDRRAKEQSDNEGALAGMGAVWRMKQGCWYASSEDERVACERALIYWGVWGIEDGEHQLDYAQGLLPDLPHVEF
eukprot:3397792-Alexandrium_andersonii.AAC.1